MMDEKTLKQIDDFVNGFIGNEKEIATAYVNVPNSINSMPEINSLAMRYGKSLSAVTNYKENCRNDYINPTYLFVILKQ